ncbi:MAG: hypothetical protein U1E65_11350 [Myxococcota bacterium]
MAIRNAPPPAPRDAAQLQADWSPTTARRADLQPAIQELQALRVDADFALPGDAVELFGPFVDLYRGQGSSGDNLRLAPATNYDAPTLRASLGRILRAEAAPLNASEADLAKEQKMRRFLYALEATTADIRRKAALGNKE